MSDHDKNDVRRRIEKEMQDVRWTPEDRRAVLNAARGGELIGRKRLSLAAVIVMALVALTVGALAATGVIFSNKVDAIKLADIALEEAYGVTPQMQSYFWRAVEEKEGVTIVHYKAYDSFTHVLGDYTVTVSDGKATAQWSWDGTPIAEDFDTAPWGAKQLRVMMEDNAKTHDSSKYFYLAEVILRTTGEVSETVPPALPTPEEQEALEKKRIDTQAKVKARMKFTLDELRMNGIAAIMETYALTDAMLPYLTPIDENEYYAIDEDGKACVSFYIGFGINAVDGTHAVQTHPEWEHLLGIYHVTVNVETSVIEDILFDSTLYGNG